MQSEDMHYELIECGLEEGAPTDFNDYGIKINSGTSGIMLSLTLQDSDFELNEGVKIKQGEDF